MFEVPPVKFETLTKVPGEYYLENRRKVVEQLKTIAGESFKADSFIVLKGHSIHTSGKDDDTTSQYYPEPNFLYVFGNPRELNIHAALNIDTMEAVLVVKDQAEINLIFEGGVTKETEIPKEFNVSRILTEEEFKNELKEKCKGQCYILDGQGRNHRTKIAEYSWLREFDLNKLDLYKAFNESRLIKSKIEQDLMREVCKITAEGHKYVMKNVRPGMGEHHIAELFKLRCGMSGTSTLAYNTICGAGRNGSILHYVINNKVVEDGEIMLCDLGVTGNRYSGDVTTTFPVNGKFDPKQAEIYNIVLKTQLECSGLLKPGYKYSDCQKRCFEILCEELLKAGFFKDATVEKLMELKMFSLVMPHSLGHFLGMYTHDVGPCIHSEEKDCYTSTSLTNPNLVLKSGMALTVEPGVYFVRTLIESFKNNPEKAPYVNFDKFEEYFYVGGVRIEDDILITDDGFENMTPVPRTVEEIEAFMKRD